MQYVVAGLYFNDMPCYAKFREKRICALDGVLAIFIIVTFCSNKLQQTLYRTIEYILNDFPVNCFIRNSAMC